MKESPVLPLRVLARVPSYLWVSGLILLALLLMAVSSRVKGMEGARSIDTAWVSEISGVGEPAAAKPVSLPHVWDNRHRQWQGQARYQLQLPADLLMQTPDGQGLALLIPRVGVRYRLSLNGDDLSAPSWKQGPGYFDTGVHAQLVVLPHSLLRSPAESNRINIDIVGEPLRISGLSAVWVGPREILAQRHAGLMWWQVSLTWMVAAAALLIGVMSLLVWLRTRELVFGFLAAGLLTWTLRLSLSVPVFWPAPFGWWDYLHKLSFTLYCGFIYLFMSELFEFRQSGARKLVLVMMWVAPLWLALTLLTEDNLFYTVWNGVILAICVAALLQVIHRARWGFDEDQRFMVVVGLATVVTGVRDYLVVQFSFPGDADVRWMTAGSLVLMCAMGWVLVQRAVMAMQQAELLNAELAREVAAREDQLHDVFERLRVAENHRILEAERRRLTRDMHDGLGSQLVQALNMVRSSGSQVDSMVMVGMLNQALEELRLTIDSLEPMEGDLPAILGTLRQRIAPALDAARIQLIWEVEDVPPLPGLEAMRVLQLFRCLQEVFANVVKHAQASQVVVRTELQAAGVLLSVCDNGVGLGVGPDAAFRVGGRGIANIRLRAAEIGAEVRFIDMVPGTCVQFLFAPPT